MLANHNMSIGMSHGQGHDKRWNLTKRVRDSTAFTTYKIRLDAINTFYCSSSPLSVTPGDCTTHLEGALSAQPHLDAQPKSASLVLRPLLMQDMTCAWRTASRTCGISAPG